MSLLLFHRRRSIAPAVLEPARRPRGWYQLLFKLYEPRDGRLAPQEALEVIERNWHRSYQDISRNGVE